MVCAVLLTGSDIRFHMAILSLTLILVNLIYYLNRKKLIRHLNNPQYSNSMEQKGQHLKLEVVETSCSFDTQLNSNCSIDGSHAVYMSGAHLVYHNVFQNTKNFVNRATAYPAIGMAFYKTNQIVACVISASPQNTITLEFYFYNKTPIVVEVPQAKNLKFVDAIFIQKRKILLITKSQKQQCQGFLVNTLKKIRKIDVPNGIRKMVEGYNKVCLVCEETERGFYEFDIDCQSMVKGKKFEGISIRHVAASDSQTYIFADDSTLYLGTNEQIFQKISLPIQKNGKINSFQKIGRNIILSYTNNLTLQHILFIQNTLKLQSLYEYPQKLKSHILHIDYSLDEMSLILSANVFYKDKYHIEYFVFNLSVLSHGRKFLNPFQRFKRIQYGEINGIESGVSSDVYFLVGSQILNFSYLESLEKKHNYHLHEYPKSMAVHPLGHQIACLFDSQLKFYQKVEGDLIQIWAINGLYSSAKYLSSGLLIMCIHEDNNYKLVFFNPNSFKKIKTFQLGGVKHSVNKLDVDENQSQFSIYSGKDVFVYRLNNGQKIAEFRQKKQQLDVFATIYDPNSKTILASLKEEIQFCQKVQNYSLGFNQQKRITIGHQITSFCINERIQTIFMGTSQGQILYSDYPLCISEETQAGSTEKQYKIKYRSFKIHYNEIKEIKITSNGKFLLATVKGDGIVMMKLKKGIHPKKQFINSFQISNYNFLEISSLQHLYNIQQKLKNLLQKRKTIFNELEEYKKDWQIKVGIQNNQIKDEKKCEELGEINFALETIKDAQREKERIQEELQQFTTWAENQVESANKSREKQLVELYVKNDQLQQQLIDVQSKCKNTEEKISQNCTTNYNEIQNDLTTKFVSFSTKYNKMFQNIKIFRKKQQYQARLQQQMEYEQYNQLVQSLKNQWEKLYKQSNDIRSEITKDKKQVDRFLNRRDFLDNKMRFFKDELTFCQTEKTDLLLVKQALQFDLSELEQQTNKKQQRLRKYSTENEILLKYQNIHEYLMKTNQHQIEFLEDQRSKLKTNISKLQKEIMVVAEDKQKQNKIIKEKQSQLELLKQKKKETSLRYSHVRLLVNEILHSIEEINNNKQQSVQSRNKAYTNLLQKYYTEKNLSYYISRKGQNQAQQRDLQLKSQNQKQQQKIGEQLNEHKDYLVKNMNLFDKYNNKVMSQINLNYLKYQTENYKLISECNVRKEQISKKKRILHELMQSIRETTHYMTDLKSQKNNGSVRIKTKEVSKKPSTNLTPFVAYEKQLQEVNKDKMLRKEKSQSNIWSCKKVGLQVRKMLDFKKIGGDKDLRRIQTAKIGKNMNQTSDKNIWLEDGDVIYPLNSQTTICSKPYTANTKNRRTFRQLQRNKSSSKPTTCTTKSKTKHSLFI